MATSTITKAKVLKVCQALINDPYSGGTDLETINRFAKELGLTREDLSVLNWDWKNRNKR